MAPVCPISRNGTCDDFTCQTFNDNRAYEEASFVIQTAGCVIHFLICLYCVYNVWRGGVDHKIVWRSWQSVEKYVRHTGTSITLFILFGSVFRAAYFVVKMCEYFIDVTYNPNIDCCEIDKNDQTVYVNSFLKEFFLFVRDVCFTAAFLLLFQSWIAVQQSLLPQNRRETARYSQYRARLVICVLAVTRFMEYILRSIDAVDNRNDFVDTGAKVLRLFAISVYAFIFVFALPYGVQMLDRLKTAIANRQSESNRALLTPFRGHLPDSERLLSLK